MTVSLQHKLAEYLNIVTLFQSSKLQTPNLQ